MSRRVYDLKNDEELKAAYWEAARGGAAGAAKWGFVGLALGTAGYFWSPLFRGLTPQFKVFLQISMMTLGGIVEADKRLIAHEKMMRRHHRQKRDAEIWQLYKEDFEIGRKEASEGNMSKRDSK